MVRHVTELNVKAEKNCIHWCYCNWARYIFWKLTENVMWSAFPGCSLWSSDVCVRQRDTQPRFLCILSIWTTFFLVILRWIIKLRNQETVKQMIQPTLRVFTLTLGIWIFESSGWSLSRAFQTERGGVAITRGIYRSWRIQEVCKGCSKALIVFNVDEGFKTWYSGKKFSILLARKES